MKKAIMILILIIVLLPLVSCEKETIYWDFEYDYTDIKQIKIAYCENSTEHYTIKDIDISLAEEVYNDIKSFKMQHTAPRSISGQAIIIIYNDGNYDLISDISCKVRYDRYEEEWHFHSLSKCSNYEDLYILIEKYLGEGRLIEWKPIEMTH